MTGVRLKMDCGNVGVGVGWSVDVNSDSGYADDEPDTVAWA